MGQSSPNFLVDATPNHAKLCGDRLKNAGDIRDRKFLLPEKVGQTTTLPHTSDQSDHNICDLKTDWYLDAHRYGLDSTGNRARQLYKNISMLFLFPVKDGKLSTGVNATFDASCYG